MSSSDSREKVILCLGGAFNPVHSRHVMAMETAKRWLEMNSNYNVVAGRLAVAPDGYVKTKVKKTGEKCMKLEHRIGLCELACEQHKNWLSPFPRHVGSAAECGEKTRLQLQAETANDNYHVAVIVGADRAMNKSGHAKWHKESSHLTLCIGRKGETARIQEQYEIDLKLNRVQHTRFYLVPEELDNISSTMVRKQLSKLLDSDRRDDKERIIQEMVSQNWISESQGKYILEHETLYL